MDLIATEFREHIDRVRQGERVDKPSMIRYGVSREEAARFGLPCGGTLRLVQPDPVVPATLQGHIGVSTDGLGTFTTGNVQAEIPAGSTVEMALLYVATRSFVGPYRPTAIGFEGSTVTLQALPNVDNAAGVDFETLRADVTSIVGTKVGATGGVFNFTVDDPRQLWEKLRDKAIVIEALFDTDYGTKKFTIADPDGNELGFVDHVA